MRRQLAADSKKNEITAIPKRLAMLTLKGTQQHACGWSRESLLRALVAECDCHNSCPIKNLINLTPKMRPVH